MIPSLHTDSFRLYYLFGKLSYGICQAARSGKKVWLPNGVQLTYSSFTNTFFVTGEKKELIIYTLGPDTQEKKAAFDAFRKRDFTQHASLSLLIITGLAIPSTESYYAKY
jgi:hypothetical protein